MDKNNIAKFFEKSPLDLHIGGENFWFSKDVKPAFPYIYITIPRIHLNLDTEWGKSLSHRIMKSISEPIECISPEDTDR